MSTIARALLLRQDLLSQIEALQARLREVEMFLHLSEKLEGKASTASRDSGLEAPAWQAPDNKRAATSHEEIRNRLVRLVQQAEERTKKLPKGKTLADAVEVILRRYRRPLSTRDLLQCLKAEGFGSLISGEDGSRQLNRLSVLMSKDDRFQADRTKGWSLRSWRGTTSWIDRDSVS